MAGFRFVHAELEREVIALKGMAKTFLDSRTTCALDFFLSQLRSIRREKSGKIRKLDLKCLRTRPSEGEYEIGDRRGGRNIHAVISGTWEVQPLGKPSSSRREIRFCGNASTRIELYDSDKPETPRLAMWRLELGAVDSPGCYVHAQILGDSKHPPFPSSVPIPRLPSLFVTPMSTVEFVLGELFQDTWKKWTSRSTGNTQNWHGLQRRWLQGLFCWYQDELNNSGSSPWMTLKSAKPNGHLILEN